MLALVAREGNARLERRPVPQPAPNEVVIRATAVSMCSADVAGAAGVSPVDEGTILGHEAVGFVHAIGAGVSTVQVGQRVAVPSNSPCGYCENCQRGLDGHCGGTDWGGYTAGVSRDGYLAPYFRVPNADFNVTPIPSGVSDEQALCATDTLLSGTTGVEAAQIPMGGTVAVFGQGHIGLAAVAAARLLGAALVIGVRARAGALDVSRAMGADLVLNAEEHEVVDEIREATRGVGVDCAVEATGVAEVFPSAVAATRTGGTVSVMSSYSGPADSTLAIPLADWGWGIGDKRIINPMQKSGRSRLARILRLIENGRLDPKPLITARYEFHQVEQAFRAVAERKPGLIKPIITFNPGHDGF